MIVPFIQYQDAPTAIDWLERVFGFERRLVVPGQANSILHAQLVLGESMLMVSSLRQATVSQSPSDTRRGLYVVVSDPDAYYQYVISQGAEITQPIED